MQEKQNQRTLQSLKGRIHAAYQYLVENKDQENAGKVKQLAQKLTAEEYTIAFCGHFSAGKSRMINRLVGGKLLPSSPIPTSANLVKVKSGDSYAKVFFKNEKPRLYQAPYDYNLVKNYCQDGDQIQEIEISQQGLKIPRGIVVMDTPGIDSADDAHRIATESAIHLADLIFYVMDYNHVQSELNFMFTKELTEAGKEVYLVVNQVDKHSAGELSFTDYQASVTEAFAAWGVKPARIFYTSLKEAAHEENQFLQLQEFLTERLNNHKALLNDSIACSLDKLLQDHLSWRERKAEAKLSGAKSILQELSTAEQNDLTANYQSLLDEKTALAGALETAAQEFDALLQKILANAYLMPFETRSLAEAYLEASAPDFKIGFFFSQKKTAAERARRCQVFYQGMAEKVNSQLIWHLRDFLAGFLRQKRLDSPELLTAAQQFSFPFGEEVLTGALKPGACLSGEYLLNYTSQVAEEIKRLAKAALNLLKEDILQELDKKNRQLEAKVAEKSVGLERYVRALEEISRAQAAAVRERQQLAARIEAAAADPDFEAEMLFVRPTIAFEIIAGQEEPLPAAEKVSVVTLKEQTRTQADSPAEDQIKSMQYRLKESARIIRNLPGFSRLSQELAEKAQRLDNKGFSVALFGAFSAGKSSFANALLGQRVLPVSPNPMTAAINRIKPVDDGHEHGLVYIRLKTPAVMLEDVNQALQIFFCQAPSLEGAVEIVAGLNGDLAWQGAAEKTNYSFLQAFSRGYAQLAAQLGTTLSSTTDEFAPYVACEEKSCFVDWIDLYYDCALTRQGITLVDTPGADSINARHTGVAFDFIKNSDAILFVTYYNHAFSKADREFLIQLGRVKDAFQLDKMFFMINAIDLADSEQEQATVVDYVRGQLIKYGVRQPQVYPLSSLQALEEKLTEAEETVSGLPEFETDFYHFITHDLATMAVRASQQELNRVEQLLKNLILSTGVEQSVKEQRRLSLETEKSRLLKILAQQTPASLERRLAQETEELVYYIKQRVFLRYYDFFKESFNPAVLRDDGRDLKQALQNALAELLAQLGFDFSQEMRATTLRLDRFAEKILIEQQCLLTETMQGINQDLSFAQYEFAGSAAIDFSPAFAALPPAMFSRMLAGFKNPKAFFERNEKEQMRTELAEILASPAEEYLAREQAKLEAVYDELLTTAFAALIKQMQEEVEAFYLSLLSALEGGVSGECLRQIQTQLQAVKK